MIDLDELHDKMVSYRLVGFTKSGISTIDALEILGRLQQAEKDAARYRSAVSILGEASEMLQLLGLSVSNVSERNAERIDGVLCEIDAELSQCSK